MKTFRIGGVHPAENKLSAGKAIETLALPKQAVFPLSQHIGAPATAIVKKGDVVKVGTKIAEAGGFVSAAIFSSVSGKVNKVDAVIDASGYRKPAIFIDVPETRNIPAARGGGQPFHQHGLPHRHRLQRGDGRADLLPARRLRPRGDGHETGIEITKSTVK